VRDLETGRILERASSPHPRTTPPLSEQHPEDWWSAFKDCLSKLTKADVVGISVAGQGHGLVLLDKNFKVIRSAKLWNDTTSSEQSKTLVANHGSNYWIDKIGTIPVASFTITKLLWVRDNEPHNFKRIRHVLLPHDYFNYRLTGVATTDRSEATGTGFFNVRTNAWDNDLLDLIGFESDVSIPKILKNGELAGVVNQEVAKELGLPLNVVVGSGANDNPSSALAYGAVNEGDLVVSFGTSGVAFTPISDPIFDYSGTVYCMANTVAGFLPLVCTLNSTKVTDLVASILDVDLHELGELALQGSNSADRVIFRPWIDGERTPNRPDARGILSNIDNGLSRANLARAAFEGVVFGIVCALEVLLKNGIEIKRVIATGGGSNSPAYLQFLADALRSPVYVSDILDAAASGIAVQSAATYQGISVIEIVQKWSPALVLGANPRSDQNCEMVMNRFRTLMHIDE
jgi:xylulokinase